MTVTGISTTYAVLNGLRIGAGSDYRFTAEPSGFDQESTGFVQTAPFTDGGVPMGGDRLSTLELVFEVRMKGDPATTSALAAALKAAWGPVRDGVLPLTVNLSGVEQVVFGRPRLCAPDPSDARFGTTRARCVFEATDPRLFSASEQSVVLGLNAGGGATAPVTAPVTAGAGSDQDASVTNAGGFDTVWRAVIAGPVTTPRLTLGETGEFVELNGTIPAGSTVIVESSDGSVLLDGSPRQNWPTFPSSFFALPSGTSTVRFRAASGSGTCTFSWRDADL